MKVSVLIAAYQAAPTIARAIASVQAQSHEDWEIIVVEDGSNDGTAGIVRLAAAPNAQEIRYENLGTNRGVAAARNRLLEVATGDAFAFLDADDWWSNDHLQRGTARLAASPGIVVSGVRTFDLASRQTLSFAWPPAELEIDPVGILFRESAIITSSSVLFSRNVPARTGEFDRSFRVGEDRDYWLRAALDGIPFRIEPNVTCNYAKHHRSAMAATLLVAAQNVRFYEKYFSHPVIPPGLRRRGLAHSLLNEARLLRRSDAAASVGRLWRAWQLTPADFSLPAHLAFSGVRALLAS